jgi:hypothetical protein
MDRQRHAELQKTSKPCLTSLTHEAGAARALITHHRTTLTYAVPLSNWQ